MIRLQDVSKRFIIHHQRATELKEHIVGRLRGRRFTSEEFWALRNVSFTIDQGESVAIIGENGSGKSTLLQLIARILLPDSGTVAVKGRVAALLELGAGFNPELTGRENIFLASAAQGFRRKEIADRVEEIIDFAEIRRFIDTPVKNYSTGMYMRLGFAVATHVDPDILLIDEILAVGDEAFQAKCVRRIERFKERGKTIIFVSHGMEAVERICDRAVLVCKGRILLDGTCKEGIAGYRRSLGMPVEADAAERSEEPESETEQSPPRREAPAPLFQPSMALSAEPFFLQIEEWVGPTGEALDGPSSAAGVIARVTPRPIPEAHSPAKPPALPTSPPPPGRRGIGFLKVVDVAFEGRGEAAIVSGGEFRARIKLAAECIIKEPVIGVAIHTEDGANLLGPNTRQKNLAIPFLDGETTIEFVVPRIPLEPGRYLFTVALFNRLLDVVYDFCDRFFKFEIQGEKAPHSGVLAIPSEFRFLSLGDSTAKKIPALTKTDG